MNTEMVQKEEWEEYVNTNTNAGFVEYIEATEQMTYKVEEILNASTSFEELKKELTNFVKERRDFTTYAGLNFP